MLLLSSTWRYCILLMIYEINQIWTAEMKWKWRNDHRSERNLCNCVKKPEKNSGLQRGLNPWPIRDLAITGASILYTVNQDTTVCNSFCVCLFCVYRWVLRWLDCVWFYLFLSQSDYYNHGQKSLGQSEHNFNSMRFASNVVKSSAVILQIHVPSPFPTEHNVERSKELCLDGFNTVRRGVGEGGREVQC